MSTNKSTCGESKRTILKSASLVSLGVLSSRLLGFIRDVVIARIFGVYVFAQAFIIAFKIPNLFRDFLGEGAANAAFVPVFSQYQLKHSKEEFWELVNIVLNSLLVILISITLLGIVFSPLIVRLIVPGFIASPEKLAITVRLNRIIFPYILLISLSAYSTAILNSLSHFAIPAFSPCLLNISIILFAFIFGEGIKGLSLGVIMGGILQLLIQVPVLYKKGFRLKQILRRFTPLEIPFKQKGMAKFLTGFKHPQALTILKLMFPRLFSFCIYQLNNFVDSIFGSLAWIVGEGGVAVLYFAYRFIQFPIGIFSNALSQAILPVFSQQAGEETQTNLKQTLSFGLGAVFLVMIPSSIGFIVLANPIIKTLFGGGRFDLYAVSLTSQALKFYSIGLFAYGANRILQTCFFALQDTLTPTKISFVSLIINVILNSILMFPLKIAGIALATSISGIISFLILFFILYNRLKGFDLGNILFSFLRILLASICMGAVSLGLIKYVNLWVVLFLGIISYIIFCFIFRVKEVKELWLWVLRRKN